MKVLEGEVAVAGDGRRREVDGIERERPRAESRLYFPMLAVDGVQIVASQLRRWW